MNCTRVLNQLSMFVDEVLDSSDSAQLSQHLERCEGCRKELQRLALLRKKLSSLGTVRAPDFLQHLVQLRLNNEQENTLRARLQNALEYRWSVIRTTEGMWYFTRFLGTVMTSVFFLMIIASIDPIYIAQSSDSGPLPVSYRQQLGPSLYKSLGLNIKEAQKRPISPSEAAINDLYFVDYAQSVSRVGSDDSFAVLVEVDRRGSAKIQNVLEYPADKTLLADFNYMITNARSRPASQNGHAVDSRMVMSFSKVSVYD